MLDESLLKNHLDNSFVHLAMIEQSEMITDIEVQVYHTKLTTTTLIFHRINIVLHIETR